jgi:hypothetical protein
MIFGIGSRIGIYFILFLFFEEPDLGVDSTYSWFYLCVELEPKFFVLKFFRGKNKK